MPEARLELANFLQALLFVYSTCLLAHIVLQFIFAMGLRVPYARWSSAILGFLRDVSEPYLRLFRRLPLQVGPLDLTPLVALLVLRFVGGAIIGIVLP
ncbi:MAG: YggT family protein [Actinomycetota bacterium]|nr:YggT family protein [Actinomycetota bacterium]